MNCPSCKLPIEDHTVYTARACLWIMAEDPDPIQIFPTVEGEHLTQGVGGDVYPL